MTSDSGSEKRRRVWVGRERYRGGGARLGRTCPLGPAVSRVEGVCVCASCAAGERGEGRREGRRVGGGIVGGGLGMWGRNGFRTGVFCMLQTERRVCQI
jgi:hypothetical protein